MDKNVITTKDGNPIKFEDFDFESKLYRETSNKEAIGHEKFKYIYNFQEKQKMKDKFKLKIGYFNTDYQKLLDEEENKKKEKNQAKKGCS